MPASPSDNTTALSPQDALATGLRHQGLFLAPKAWAELANAHLARPLPHWHLDDLRSAWVRFEDKQSNLATFANTVLEKVCDLGDKERWDKTPEASWRHTLPTGESLKPDRLWRGASDGILPVFFSTTPRLGLHKGRKIVADVAGWLRAAQLPLAVLTNGHQWRVLAAGLDSWSCVESETSGWLVEGTEGAPLRALRTLLQPALWDGKPGRLAELIQSSREGQTELSALLGERVRQAVERLIVAHGTALQEANLADEGPAIYQAACRVVMRLVVILFAEARELLPLDNPAYHHSYSLGGLLTQLEQEGARSSERLRSRYTSWPRLLALFRLMHGGSHHEALPVPSYGGSLFAVGSASSTDPVERAIALFESACLTRTDTMPDSAVREILQLLTRAPQRVRQGRGQTLTMVPVNFADLSSEYIGILYEGLLDYELKMAQEQPVLFLPVGHEPALPLDRLEAMADGAIKDLFDKLKKDAKKKADAEEEGEEDSDEEEEAPPEEQEEDEIADGEDAEAAEEPPAHEIISTREQARLRAQTWAARAVVAIGSVKPPRGNRTPEKTAQFEQAKADAARKLVKQLILPGEFYLVRWGGTRKGAGTFYTRPGLSIPTVQRTLRPLAWDPPKQADGSPDTRALGEKWTPKKPEEILKLKVCDPACGSGSFPVAALRFLTDSLMASIQHHKRLEARDDQTIAHLLGEGTGQGMSDEMIPARQGDDGFEDRLEASLKRHVVERCIYGVDLDPLAVELCRLALWIETMDPRLPFTFLDHKIQCGNGLIGTWFDRFAYYPAMAWKGREDGDGKSGVRTQAIKEFCNGVAKELAEQIGLPTNIFTHEQKQQGARDLHDKVLTELEAIHNLPVHDSEARAQCYQALITGSEYRKLKTAFDLWCSCWFWPGDQIKCAPTPGAFASPSPETLAQAKDLAKRINFFHWELAFPDVFNKIGSGFDAIIGNPPWETLQPNSKEFFSGHDPLYRSYGKQEALKKQKEYFSFDQSIERRWMDYTAFYNANAQYFKFQSNPWGDPKQAASPSEKFNFGKGSDALHLDWRRERSKTEGYSDPIHPYRCLGGGKAYTQNLFLEQAHALLRNGGRMGLIVPSGIYSDKGTQSLRELFLNYCQWEWLFGFENREGIFEIHRSFKFNPIIVQKGGHTQAIQVAFMRRKLDDWVHAEAHAVEYPRAQVPQFSAKSSAILEISSEKDLEILKKMYANGVLLGDESEQGWGVKYQQGDFNMASDSALFPPRNKWEADGYCADEYNRWLLGDWRPISELWQEMGVEPLVKGQLRLAQPPYDQLPVPRSVLPAGVILSREADAFIREDAVNDIALPLYEGRMIGIGDPSAKGWVSGKGRGAIWESSEWETKTVKPQFLVSKANWNRPEKGRLDSTVTHKRIGASTNSRSSASAVLWGMPGGDTASMFWTQSALNDLSLSAAINSFVFDHMFRLRMGGLHLDYHVYEQCAVPSPSATKSRLHYLEMALSQAWARGAPFWISHATARTPLYAITTSERIRLRAIADVLVAALYHLTTSDLQHILSSCDHPAGAAHGTPKGFWRIDKTLDPELRQTVLTLVAFHDLEQHITAANGNRDAGIESFMAQNNGQGWLIPDTLRLADYGLGYDDRAKEPQPVASRLGPRFLPWQEAQTSEEAWQEVHLHARNLLGEAGYRQLCAENHQERMF